MIEGTSRQTITFPNTVNQPHCFNKPIPLFLPSRVPQTFSPVQQPFKQVPASESAYRRRRVSEKPNSVCDLTTAIDPFYTLFKLSRKAAVIFLTTPLFQEVPSPSKEMIANIDAGVKRVKSAVISRMSQTQRKDQSQYFGWLLKAR